MASPEVEHLVRVIRDNAPTGEGWGTGFTAGESLQRHATAEDLPYLREELEACGREQGYLASVICLILIELGSAPDILLVVDSLRRPYGRNFYRDAVLGALPALVERDPEAAAPIVRDLLASREPTFREHGAALYPHARGVLPIGPLLDASRDYDPDVSVTAFGSLWGNLELPEVRARFLEALADPNEVLVETAIESLSVGEVVEAVPQLRLLQQHPSGRVRAAAQAALTRLDRLPLK
ncbi:hypothetical protein R5W24_004804 [Gemmata sp. JC717]|uniref:HEAT repeat domain-containing protein n=1 Tax=Gemmata algarum TaxID=2975278 RepID=UPI0021BBA6DB|nr:HEAT repeat domain-containing protein [Gemmata algarum]MDY3555659.1 hypothetical protein [Gemmata algarum]